MYRKILRIRCFLCVFFLLLTFWSSSCHATTCNVGNLFLYGSTVSSLANCSIIIGNLTLGKNLTSSELNLPLLNSIVGNLWMYSTELTNVDGLSNLSNVDGSLSIGASTNLTSLAGLGKLIRVGGSVNIVSNNALPTTSELRVQKIGGGVTVINNYMLQDLTFLNGFTIIAGGLNIQANPHLNDASGLSALEEVKGTFYFYGNPYRNGIGFLDNLNTVEQDFFVEQVNAYTAPWFPNLDVIGGDLHITRVVGNDTDWIVCPNIRKIGGDLELSYLTGIKSINGFGQLTFADEIAIYNTHGLLEINTFYEVNDVGSITLDENYDLLTVRGLGTTNFTQINGTIHIFLNPMLQDINFLSSLQRIVQGTLLIENCSSLETLDPLSNLFYIGGSLIIYGNPLIKNIDALRGLHSIGQELGNAGPMSVHIKYNSALQHIDGLSSITNIQGDIEVFGNDALVSVAGFCNLTTIPYPVTVGGPNLCCPSAASVFPAQAAGLLSLIECATICDISNNYSCTCFPPNPDPSNPRASRCVNGGICHPLPNGFFCDCPPGFIGSTCEVPLPTLSNLDPSATSLLGGINMTLRGLYPPNATDVYIDGVPLDYRDFSYISANDSFKFWFLSPEMNETGYKNITLASRYYALQNTSRSDLLYYVPVTMKDCIKPGMFWYGNKCQNCPPGGYCPGADRVWPHRGYWSFNEKTLPVPCRIYEACPGALGEDPLYPALQSPDGSRNTSQCSFAVGYNGLFCDSCRFGFYQDGPRCRTCGETSSDYSEFIGLVIAALIFFGLCALAVGIFSDKQLASGVTFIVHFQQFIVVGVLVSPFLFNDQGSGVFRILSLLNFDVQYFKPGCSIPRFSYIVSFWVTMLVFLIAAIMFVIAAGVRSLLLKEETVKKSTVSRRKLWKRRTVHALIILGNIIYLQFCLRTLEGISCTKINGVRRLRVSLSTDCSSPEHIGWATAIYVIFFSFGFGFPGYCFYVLRRVARIRESVEAGLTDPKRMMKYSYLYRQCKPQYYWFRWLNFVTSFVLAVESTVASSIGVQMLIAFILFTINVVLVLWLWPLKKWYFNASLLVTGGASVIQAIYYLYNLQTLLFYVTFPLLAFFFFSIAILRYCGITFERVRDCLLRQKHVPPTMIEKFGPEKVLRSDAYESGLINDQLLETKQARLSIGDPIRRLSDDMEPNPQVISSADSFSSAEGHRESEQTFPKTLTQRRTISSGKFLDDSTLPGDIKMPPLALIRSISAPESSHETPTSSDSPHPNVTTPTPTTPTHTRTVSRQEKPTLFSSRSYSVSRSKQNSIPSRENSKLVPVELTSFNENKNNNNEPQETGDNDNDDDDTPPGLEEDSHHSLTQLPITREISLGESKKKNSKNNTPQRQRLRSRSKGGTITMELKEDFPFSSSSTSLIGLSTPRTSSSTKGELTSDPQDYCPSPTQVGDTNRFSLLSSDKDPDNNTPL